MLLGLYPVAELTRVIIINGIRFFPEMTGQFMAEIVLMWVLYLLIIPLLLKFDNLFFHYSQKSSRKDLVQADNTVDYIDASKSLLKKREVPYKQADSIKKVKKKIAT